MWRFKKRDTITILTDPIPPLSFYYKEKIKSFFRPVLRMIDGKQPLVKIKYRGHYAVTRSLVEGLIKLNIPFVYNPQTIKQCSEKVVVLAGMETLKQALELKNTGKIKWLAAGPNLVVMPSDNPTIIGSKLIDKCIVNSEWIKNAYCAEMPHLFPYTIIWPAGVDVEYWKPDSAVNKSNKVLFYSKNLEPGIKEKCKSIAERKGLVVAELVYGEYTQEQYKKLLQEVSWMVYFGKQESQGIALLESWAMDVPTIVWNPETSAFKGVDLPTSAAPYLSPDTGMFFKDELDFEAGLDQILAGGFTFCSRDWVLQNMTDEKATINLIQQLSFFKNNEA